MIGKLLALAQRAPGTPAPSRVDTLTALAGIGLAGDRHCDARSPRQVLLAGAPAYDAFKLPPLSLRENLLLDIDTADLASGMLLRVGPDAVFRLSFQCEACGALDIHRPGLARALGHRRGMLARVVAGGVIRTGDPVEVLARRMPAMGEDWRERVAQVLAAMPPGMVLEYAELARLAGIQPSYCRAFPRLLAARGMAGRAVPARSPCTAPRWDGAGLFD
ncbi:MAG: hypothetical protein EOP92_17675 [Lysobacteraceae bacterium]|nr:MAG: hypothetical protein EOP92_17675 [Xanthomonadaceae bacterium]